MSKTEAGWVKYTCSSFAQIRFGNKCLNVFVGSPYFFFPNHALESHLINYKFGMLGCFCLGILRSLAQL